MWCPNNPIRNLYIRSRKSLFEYAIIFYIENVKQIIKKVSHLRGVKMKTTITELLNEKEILISRLNKIVYGAVEIRTNKDKNIYMFIID